VRELDKKCLPEQPFRDYVFVSNKRIKEMHDTVCRNTRLLYAFIPHSFDYIKNKYDLPLEISAPVYSCCLQNLIHNLTDELFVSTSFGLESYFELQVNKNHRYLSGAASSFRIAMQVKKYLYFDNRFLHEVQDSDVSYVLVPSWKEISRLTHTQNIAVHCLYDLCDAYRRDENPLF
jgi:hypothetical protein